MIDEDKRRKIATQVAFSFLGLPYLWGGDDPVAGFDCSGMCIEILKAVGLLPGSGDWTAAGLWKHFADNHGCAVSMDTQLYEGCLVFWASPQDPQRIVHVEYAINEELCIGASGGGSRTKGRADAIEQNAYIKVRPHKNRAHMYGVVDPFRLIYGGGYTGSASEPE